MDHDIGGDLTIAKHTIWADTHTITERHATFEDDVHVNQDIAANGNRAPNVDSCRVDHGGTCKHDLARP